MGYHSAGALIDPKAPYIKRREAQSAAVSDGEGTSNDENSTGLPKLTVIKGVAAPLDIQNIDTDMIIPKEFLKTIKRSGLGFAAFAELRYENPLEVATIGEEIKIPRKDFILNQEGYNNGVTSILICG